MRRLECQALALFGQHGFQLCQRGAATRRHHQLTGLVADDAAVGAGVEHCVAGRGGAVKMFAVAALDTQCLPAAMAWCICA
jgi:hypothetical protein